MSSYCRVLNCIFEHHVALFTNVRLKRYIPPISVISNLPDSPQAIEEEMRKQESLLAELHAEISSGVVVGKAREEQLWEQQRIVTQLKRNLRHAKTNTRQQPVEMDYEEELNFALQSPGEKTGGVVVVSSPEEGADQEHRVTVQIHRDNNTSSSKNITVIKLSATQTTPAPSTSSLPTVTPSVAPPVITAVAQSTSKVTSLPAVSVSVSTPSSTPASTPAISSTPAMSSTTPVSASVVSPVKVSSSISASKATTADAVDSSEVEEPAQSTQSQQVVSFSSPILPKKAISVNQQPQQSSSTTSKIPLLPPPPASSKPKTHKRTNSR